MNPIQLAYSNLNLRWNPFGEVSLEDLAELAVVQVDPYIERLRSPGFALQFLGDMGRGKTTHLLAIRHYFPQAPYIHFAPDQKIPEIPQAPILFLDETQLLPRALRRRIFSRQASFVIGTHRDHSAELKKAGKACVSITIKGLSPSKLEAIIERRIEWARRSPGPVPTISRPEIEQLIQKYGDDLSAIFDRLYEDFYRLEKSGNVPQST